MADRTDLQTILEGILGSDHVYFQPPETFKLSYPCIVYSRTDIDTRFADNLPYSHTKEYTLTVMDRDPDSNIPNRIADLPKCRFDRHYAANQLNHDVFTILF